MEGKRISKAVIQRLPRYYRYLENLMAEGVERISSKDLSAKMHVTASQIRQDLNNFGGFGQQGYGYNVSYLHDEIGKILGLNEGHELVIVGVGNVGRALAGYLSPTIDGFHLCGLFDTDPAKIGAEISDLPVRSMEELPGFLKEHNIDIAVLTVPGEFAKEVADILVENGIRAIWNFARIDLNLIVPKGVVVENVHLLESLMKLSYNSTNKEGRKI